MDAMENLPGADARKFPADPELRVKKNLEEGRGFKLNDMLKSGKRGQAFLNLQALMNFGELLLM